MIEKTEGTITNGQFRVQGNIGQRTQSGDKQNERRKNTEKYGPHKNETMNQGARGE
jgi:hypothetical protein